MLPSSAMSTNVASEDPPMTVAQREKLQQHKISFYAPPHEIVFNSNAANLMTKQQLYKFVDSVLLKLGHEFPLTEGPKPGAWKLMSKNVEEDLQEWNPHKLASGALIIIKSNKEKHRPMITEKCATQGQSWGWAHGMKTFELPVREVFLLGADSHVLLILRCQTKVKVSGKPKKISETVHSVLVPLSHTMSDILRLIRANHVNGIYQDPHEENLRLDQRSATELGWRNGTTLRIELW